MLQAQKHKRLQVFYGERMSSQTIGDKSLYRNLGSGIEPESGVKDARERDTPDRVYSHRLSYCF